MLRGSLGSLLGRSGDGSRRFPRLSARHAADVDAEFTEPWVSRAKLGTHGGTHVPHQIRERGDGGGTVLYHLLAVRFESLLPRVESAHQGQGLLQRSGLRQDARPEQGRVVADGAEQTIVEAHLLGIRDLRHDALLHCA
jgi:hypothetical protein